MKTVAFLSAGSNSGPLVLKSVALPTEQRLCSLMSILVYTIGFNTLVWMNTNALRLIKIYFEVPEDSAFISSKFHFNRCRHDWDIGVTVLQTDIRLFSLYSRRLSRLRAAGFATNLSLFKGAVCWYCYYAKPNQFNLLFITKSDELLRSHVLKWQTMDSTVQ